jgi:hypothetical protein
MITTMAPTLAFWCPALPGAQEQRVPDAGSSVLAARRSASVTVFALNVANDSDYWIAANSLCRAKWSRP